MMAFKSRRKEKSHRLLCREMLRQSEALVLNLYMYLWSVVDVRKEDVRWPSPMRFALHHLHHFGSWLKYHEVGTFFFFCFSLCTLCPLKECLEICTKIQILHRHGIGIKSFVAKIRIYDSLFLFWPCSHHNLLTGKFFFCTHFVIFHSFVSF